MGEREMTPAETLKCREEFVALIRDENSMREGWARQSIKQHWMGPLAGFSAESLHARWNDFKHGWKAAIARLQQEKPRE